MFVWKTWTEVKSSYGTVTSKKTYKLLLLFGIVPLFVSIDG